MVKAKSILQKLIDAGYEAYFCGGYVRDTILRKACKDIDITTSARPDQIKALFEKTIDVGAAFGTVIVVIDDEQYEVTTFRHDLTEGRHPEVAFSNNAMDDVMRRDFTVNGLLMDVDGNIIDYVDGIADIKAKKIRCIGDPCQRFHEDSLRIMRAARFCSSLLFSPDPRTAVGMAKNSGMLFQVSRERIRDEFNKGLCGKHPKRFIDILDYAGVLERVFPALLSLKGCTQGADHHPEGDVWKHTIAMLYGDSDPIIQWAALLHDIGKPNCRKEENGKISFHGHAEEGEKIARSILRHFKFSNDFIDTVCTLVNNHMDYMNVKQMKMSTLKKFISRPTHDLEIELHKRDLMASNHDTSCIEFVEEFKKITPTITVDPPAFIRGDKLISLGYKPGPKIGEILDWVRDQQLEGLINSQEQAIEEIKRRFP